jgi:hypothetical protein
MRAADVYEKVNVLMCTNQDILHSKLKWLGIAVPVNFKTTLNL